MSFTMELYQLLIRYTKDLDGKDITLRELQHIDWWRCVWGSWMAKAYYKMDGYYERIEDVPEGLEDYRIITKSEMTHYFISHGQMRTQSMTKDTCKSIYGSVI